MRVATLLLFGTRPYAAFPTYQLPRLASGEAFSFAGERIRPLTLNGSVMGLPSSWTGWIGLALPWGPSTIRFDMVFTMISFFAALGLCSVVLLDPRGKVVLARIRDLRGPA